MHHSEGSLDSGESLPVTFPSDLMKLTEYPPALLTKWELEFLQGCISFPTWMLYHRFLKVPNRVRGGDLKHYVGRQVLLFGIRVTSKITITKDKKELRVSIDLVF